jgi:hypothetical protein
VGALRLPGKGTVAMTQQKALKARVRARMTKTGERYTAARAHLVHDAELAASDHPAPELAVPGESPSADSSPEPPTDAPDSPFRGAYGASDAALLRRTGHDWAHWYRILDTTGAATKSHREIARFLSSDLGVDGWWSQEITVRYEMAIGRRLPGQRPDGFEATAAKTIRATPDRVYEAVLDEGLRERWLGRSLRVRKASENRTASAYATVRFDWEDPEQRIVIWMTDKGDRTAVSLAHQRMPDKGSAEAMKAFWRERLAALAALVEAGH